MGALSNKSFIFCFPMSLCFPSNKLTQTILLCLATKMFYCFIFVSVFGLDFGLSGNETDRLALLAIKSEIIGGIDGPLSSWKNSIHHCKWVGVTCSRKHQRVTVLDLNSRDLVGKISPSIGNLTFLHSVILFNNTLTGPIPPEIGRLFRLQRLSLNNNSIGGEIPTNISHCLNLEYLNVGSNNLTGRVPSELNALSKLKLLIIRWNYLSGPIFESIRNLTSLERISGSSNAFDGLIPDTICQMRNLTIFTFAENRIAGKIPIAFYNLSSLIALELSENQLHGNLPQDIAFRLTNLEVLHLSNNSLTGALPISLSNFTSLKNIELAMNNFIGSVPYDFGRLKNLNTLNLGYNQLGEGDMDGLNFLNTLVNCSEFEQLLLEGNSFQGVLPESIANLSTRLYLLTLGYNQLSRRIPSGITNLVNLEIFTALFNQFTGTIPHEIGKLKSLQIMQIQSNNFTGSIPPSLGNLSMLSELRFSRNQLQGNIPTSLENCQNLLYFDISANSLTGHVPNNLFVRLSKLFYIDLSQNHFKGPMSFEFGKQTNLVHLDVSNNEFSGEIPQGLEGCTSISYINMSFNSIHGSIPPSLKSLTSVQTLDLSHNNLSGQIPPFICNFPLTYLNLSYNYFEGEVPTKGVFLNTSALDLDSNNKLCGGIPTLHLPGCVTRTATKRKFMSLKTKLIISFSCALPTMFVVSYLCYIFRKKKPALLVGLSSREPFMKVSYDMLLKATEGFSSANLLGKGTYGSVIKGILTDGTMVAVKMLNLERQGASRSFMAECKVLRNLRHRNLVKVITACSSIDFRGNDFKALVYEFMPLGSLESWLHPNVEGDHRAHEHVRNLNLHQRVNISIDVAYALDYLHHDCQIPVMHCDLKPSNILLNNDMVAKIGDFGLARFLVDTCNPSQSSSTGVRGTIGYAAPEYGLGSQLSSEGDLYSYGILLLEMMTGKRPTDVTFHEGLNLHNYAKMALPNNVRQIIDPKLLIDENATTSNRIDYEMECIARKIKIGVACSIELPQDRLKMKDAISELQSARNFLIGTHRRH